MTRVRFKLSTLLFVFSFLAVTIGLGYQIVALRQEIVEVTREVQSLKKQGSAVRVVYPQGIGQPVQPSKNARKSPFRLLDSDVIEAGERDVRRRVEKYQEIDQ
jgi:hypothetical protein